MKQRLSFCCNLLFGNQRTVQRWRNEWMRVVQSFHVSKGCREKKRASSSWLLIPRTNQMTKGLSVCYHLPLYIHLSLSLSCVHYFPWYSPSADEFTFSLPFQNCSHKRRERNNKTRRGTSASTVVNREEEWESQRGWFSEWRGGACASCTRESVEREIITVNEMQERRISAEMNRLKGSTLFVERKREREERETSAIVDASVDKFCCKSTFPEWNGNTWR